MNVKKHTDKTRLFSILLMLCMVMSLLPMTALAAPTPTPITEVDVFDIALPVAGNTPDYDVTLPADANYRLATIEEIATFAPKTTTNASKNGVVWLDEETNEVISPDTAFVAEKEYSVGVILASKEGYIFAESATGTINGSPELYSEDDSYITGAIFAFNSLPLKAKAGSGTTTPTKEITEVDVSGITLPKLGEKPDYEGILPKGAPYRFATNEEMKELEYGDDYIKYTKNGISWWNYDNEMIEPDSMFDGSSFEYYVDIVLIPENGYVFAANVTATINGEATLVDTESSENNETYYILESDYLKLEMPESAQIKQAGVSDIALPVIGETPDYNVTLPAEAKYRLATKEEIAEFADEKIANASQNGVIWRDAEKMSPISPDTKFVEGKQYSVEVLLSAKDGYVFVESATGTINGKSELYSEDYSSITGKIFGLASVEFTAQKGYSIIEGADQTWAKGSTDGIEITSDAPFDRFVKVMVDGTELAKAYYTASEGSTKILLKSTYLESLTNREHSIGIVSYLEDMHTTSSASTSFTIQPAAPSVQGDYVTITVKKTVELSGNQAPGKETFTFELKPIAQDIDISDFTVSGTAIDTNGKGTYTGIITISGNLEKLAKSKGLTLTEKDEDKANWTYDTTEYLINIYEVRTNNRYKVSVSQATGAAPSTDATAEFTNTYNCSSITIPFKKIVALGGSQAPRSTTFTLEYKPFENVDISELIIGGNAIRTNGKGKYDGTITITGDLDLIGRAGGLIFSEKNDGAANWTYSDKAYIVHVDKMGAGEYQYFVQEYMGPNTNPAPANAIEFTNTYANNSSAGGGIVIPVSCTLTFDTNGGSKIEKITQLFDSVVKLERYNPTKDGHTFDGWYADTALTDKVTSVKLTKDITVYAKWVQNSGAGLPFTDVNNGDWFYDDVAYVFERGLMNGTSSTTFSPNMSTTRGMIVTIIYRLAGSPTVSGKCPFGDVESGMYYEAPIAWAAANGIVNGYSADKFGPEDLITREQMAAILCRYAQYKGIDVSARADLSRYNDAAKVSDWAEDGVAWAVKEGIFNGIEDSLLSPRTQATRAQIATILHRFCENIAK